MASISNDLGVTDLKNELMMLWIIAIQYDYKLNKS